MGDKQILGCYDKAANQVTFQEESCARLDYCGEIEWTGEHAGMVAVTIVEENCDDTYYGCVDWTTGKFKVYIPDDCCGYCGDADHCKCFPTGESPAYYRITFEGVTLCNPEAGWPYGIPIDGVFYLPCYPSSYGCIWRWQQYPEDPDSGWYIWFSLSSALYGGGQESDYLGITAHCSVGDFFRTPQSWYHNHYPHTDGYCNRIEQFGIISECSCVESPEAEGGTADAIPAFGVPEGCPETGGPWPIP